MTHRFFMPQHAVPTLLVLCLAGACGFAAAQPADSAQAAPLPPRTQIGDATSALLALQRDGTAASPTARPIAGDVAHLSYQRYLDSFDGAKHPIPEKFGTTVKSDSGQGATGR
jgi:hypothetical protein